MTVLSISHLLETVNCSQQTLCGEAVLVIRAQCQTDTVTLGTPFLWTHWHGTSMLEACIFENVNVYCDYNPMIMSVSELYKGWKGRLCLCPGHRKRSCVWLESWLSGDEHLLLLQRPNYLQLPFRGAMPSSGLHAYQACTGCSYIHAGKILMHTKIK